MDTDSLNNGDDLNYFFCSTFISYNLIVLSYLFMYSFFSKENRCFFPLYVVGSWE
jgi:hypothetical protein